MTAFPTRLERRLSMPDTIWIVLGDGRIISMHGAEENGDLVEAIQNLMVTLMYDGYDGKGDPARQIQERIDIARELPKKISALSAMEKAKIPAAIIERA